MQPMYVVWAIQELMKHSKWSEANLNVDDSLDMKTSSIVDLVIELLIWCLKTTYMYFSYSYARAHKNGRLE